MTTPIFRDYAYPPSHPLHLPHSSSHRSDPNPSNTNDTVLEEDDDLSEDEYPYRRKAIALFDFEPEHETEFALKAGQTMWISHKHGQGWLVAEDIKTGLTGLVPEEYVKLSGDAESEWEDLEDDDQRPGDKETRTAAPKSPSIATASK